MSELKVDLEQVLDTLHDFPEAKAALEQIFPTLKDSQLKIGDMVRHKPSDGSEPIVYLGTVDEVNDLMKRITNVIKYINPSQYYHSKSGTFPIVVTRDREEIYYSSGGLGSYIKVDK